MSRASEYLPAGWMGAAARRLRPGAMRNGVTALADQLVVSAANLVTSVIIGRSSKEEFGLYSLGLSIVLFTTTLQSALILTPYMIYSPRMRGKQRARYCGSTLVHQAGFSAVVVIALALGAAAIALGVGRAELAPVLWALVAVLAFVLLREYARQICFANLRPEVALALDCCAAVLQVGGFGLLAFYGVLSAGSAFWIIGIAGCVASLGWLAWARREVTVQAAATAADLRRNWSFSKWVFPSAVAWALTTYLYPWLLAGFHGTGSAGVWAACLGILAVVNPLVLGVQNSLGPSIAHSYAGGDRAALRRHVFAAAAVLSAVLLPLCTALLIAGGPLVVLVYGDKYAGNGMAVAWLATSMFIGTVTFAFSRGLYALERAPTDFCASMMSLAFLLAAGVWLVRAYDVAGATFALMLGNLVGLAVRSADFLRSVRAVTEPQDVAAAAHSSTTVPAETAQPGPDISIVLCTYNRGDMLRDALDDLIGQETAGAFSYEIVVVDDGSTDGTPHIAAAAAERSPIRLRYVRENGEGYTHAMNRGVGEGRSRWLAFFDDDQRVDPDWLQHLYAAAAETGADMVGCNRVLDLPEAELAQMGRAWRATCGEVLPRRGFLGLKVYYFPCGGNLLMKRSVFDAVGPFDETLLTGGCDRDLVLRAHRAGYRKHMTGATAIRHAVPPDRNTLDRLRFYSLQLGCSLAHLDWKQGGAGRTLLHCAVHVAKLSLVEVPLLLFGLLAGRRAAVMDHQLRWWRTVAYVRKTMSLLLPRLFPQQAFLDRYVFRKARGD